LISFPSADAVYTAKAYTLQGTGSTSFSYLDQSWEPGCLRSAYPSYLLPQV
jgi:hypothetical protein